MMPATVVPATIVPATIVLVAWILFGGSHLAMSSSRLRERIAPRFNAAAFTLLFATVTILTMGALIVACALYADQGRAGLALGHSGVWRWLLLSTSFCGVVLMIAGLINFRNTPFAALASRMRNPSAKHTRLQAPNGLERLARHPFFFGLALVSVAHALQASTLALTIYFLGFALTSICGIYLQDRKLRSRWPQEYAEYEEQTGKLLDISATTAAPQPWSTWLASLAAATALAIWLHPLWAYANGAGFAMFILIFGTLATSAALLKSRSAGAT